LASAKKKVFKYAKCFQGRVALRGGGLNEQLAKMLTNAYIQSLFSFYLVPFIAIQQLGVNDAKKLWTEAHKEAYDIAKDANGNLIYNLIAGPYTDKMIEKLFRRGELIAKEMKRTKEVKPSLAYKEQEAELAALRRMVASKEELEKAEAMFNQMRHVWNKNLVAKMASLSKGRVATHFKTRHTCIPCGGILVSKEHLGECKITNEESDDFRQILAKFKQPGYNVWVENADELQRMTGVCLRTV
jgi:hypothetical protein